MLQTLEKVNITDKIRNTAIEMMKEVSVDEKHNYTRNSDGKYLAGVTSITGLLPKEWAIPFGSKAAVKDLGYYDELEGETQEQELKNLIELHNKIKNATSKEYLEMLRAAKGAPQRKSKDALDIGKLGHDYLEQIIKAKMRNLTIPILPKELKEIEKFIKLFLDWQEKNVATWILSEARVADPFDNEYAGTLDALALMKTGRIALLDYKFAAHISQEFFMQTAAYQYPFEKQGIHIDERIIVRIPKTDFLPEWDKKLKKYKKVKNEFEAVVVPTPYEYDFKCFAHLREVARHLNFIKEFIK